MSGGCVCVCLVPIRCFVLFIFFLTQRLIKVICGMLMPYNVGNIMRVGGVGVKGY